MSDSAPLNQQQSSSKMQPPVTSVRDDSVVVSSVTPPVVQPEVTEPIVAPLVAQKVAMPAVSRAVLSPTQTLPVQANGQNSSPVSLGDQSSINSSVAAAVQTTTENVSAPTVPTTIPPVVSQTPAPVAVPTSVTPHKEAAPVAVVPSSGESSKQVEVIQQSTPEVAVPPEIKEVVAVSEEAKPIKIDTELKKAGVALAADSTPVAHSPTGDVKLPMTYADALATEKRTKFWDAVHWFAAYVVYQWRKLDPTLKD